MLTLNLSSSLRLTLPSLKMAQAWRILVLVSAASGFMAQRGAAMNKPKRRVAPRVTAFLDVFVSAAVLTSPLEKQPSLPSVVIAKTETREGIYGSYEVQVPDEPQNKRVDDARSTFKTRAQTKKNRNKYVGIFAVLLVGSFIIPMVQYFWRVDPLL